MRLALAGIVGLVACAESVGTPPASDATTPDPAHPVGPDGGVRSPAADCTADSPLRVHFYDAGQALSALVTLPDGRHVLVDAGESPTRPCSACKTWHERVMAGVRTDLGTMGLDALWITHQHSDHVGGAEDVLTTFKTALYVDNGLDLTATAGVRNARTAAAASGATVHVVDPENPTTPITGKGALGLTAIVPSSWPSTCPTDPNACSIALRVDYCRSSILFTGDAPMAEESAYDPKGEVTLLQVGHHGSQTSTGTGFLQRISPRYAVISAGKPGEGTNDTYCHPSSSTVEDLTTALGGAGSKTMRAFDARAACKSGASDWIDVPASDRLWLTARDGDITLVTTGDGTFTKD